MIANNHTPPTEEETLGMFSNNLYPKLRSLDIAQPLLALLALHTLPAYQRPTADAHPNEDKEEDEKHVEKAARKDLGAIRRRAGALIALHQELSIGDAAATIRGAPKQHRPYIYI